MDIQLSERRLRLTFTNLVQVAGHWRRNRNGEEVWIESYSRKPRLSEAVEMKFSYQEVSIEIEQ